MTKTILSVLFLTSILLTASFAVSMNLFGNADAWQNGPSRKVCGDQLCSKVNAKPPVVKPNATETETPTEPTTPTETPTEPVMPEKTHSWNIVTDTITSVQDPGQGHNTHQLAIILPPSNQTYSGVLTYSASTPVQLVVLHGPLAEGEDDGQAIWTADGKTKYAMTFIDPKAPAGSWNFAGNALAVHTKTPAKFNVSYSVKYMEYAPSETVVTSTITSTQDPGQGHEAHQLAVILPQSEKPYSGVLTYSASQPVQLVALHGPLAEGEDVGQAIWTIDGKTKYALTLIDPKTSVGSWEFAGNALAIHTANMEPFTVSYSVVAKQ